jgi:hypothetical protein
MNLIVWCRSRSYRDTGSGMADCPDWCGHHSAMAAMDRVCSITRQSAILCCIYNSFCFSVIVYRHDMLLRPLQQQQQQQQQPQPQLQLSQLQLL